MCSGSEILCRLISFELDELCSDIPLTKVKYRSLDPLISFNQFDICNNPEHFKILDTPRSLW